MRLKVWISSSEVCPPPPSDTAPNESLDIKSAALNLHISLWEEDSAPQRLPGFIRAFLFHVWPYIYIHTVHWCTVYTRTHAYIVSGVSMFYTAMWFLQYSSFPPATKFWEELSRSQPLCCTSSASNSSRDVSRMHSNKRIVGGIIWCHVSIVSYIRVTYTQALIRLVCLYR